MWLGYWELLELTASIADLLVPDGRRSRILGVQVVRCGVIRLSVLPRCCILAYQSCFWRPH